MLQQAKHVECIQFALTFWKEKKETQPTWNWNKTKKEKKKLQDKPFLNTEFMMQQINTAAKALHAYKKVQVAAYLPAVMREDLLTTTVYKLLSKLLPVKHHYLCIKYFLYRLWCLSDLCSLRPC